MNWKHLFARKDLEMLLAEMTGEHRLHRVLGPVALTCWASVASSGPESS